MLSEQDKAVDELLNAIKFLIEDNYKKTTKIYEGIIVGDNGDDTWKIKYNGHIEVLPHYGDNAPQIGKNVKIYIPQGNGNLAYFA